MSQQYLLTSDLQQHALRCNRAPAVTHELASCEPCCRYLMGAIAGVQEQQQPEVLRMPLESLCLSVKVCLPHIAALQEALARLLSPPTEQAVAAAVRSLKVAG